MPVPMTSREEWTWSKRLLTMAEFAVAVAISLYLTRFLLDSAEGNMPPKTPIFGQSSPFRDLLVYSLAAAMPLIGMVGVLITGFGWPAKYRRLFIPALVGYLLFLAVFAALVYLN